MLITIKQIVVVEQLYIKLYKIFSEELMKMNIGYDFNISKLRSMLDLVNSIDYIQNGNPSRKEIIKIIQYYG
jgi:hypothetical protein